MLQFSRLLRRLGPLLGLGLLGLAPACNIVPDLKATPRIGTLELTGDLSISSTGATASADVEDLGFDDDGSTFAPRVDLAWGPVDIIATGYQAAYEGQGTADVALDLGGVVITAGDTVDSELDLTTAGVIATWDFIPTDLVDLGIGLGVQAIDLEASITSQTTGDTISTDESAPFPVVAARAGVQIFDLELTGVASGIAFEQDDFDATYLDIDLMASWTFERFLGFHGALVLGWRQVMLEADYEDSSSDVDLDFTLSGPFFGLTLGI